MLKAFRIQTGVLLLAVPCVSASLIAQEAATESQVIQLAPFSSIEARNGAHVFLRPGATQRVTVTRGSLQYSRVVVTGGRLLIDKCSGKCPRGYRLEIEVTVPASLASITLRDGGIVQTRGTFRRQAELAVAVSSGGTIDVRSLMADRVTAAVEQGGRIYAAVDASLIASVNNGGAIIYWGDGQVRSSIEHGGVVMKGRADEIGLPSSELVY